MALTVKNPPAMLEIWVRSLGWEDPLEEGMATHSSILAWRIPMDRGAWRVAIHGVAKSPTPLSDQEQHRKGYELLSSLSDLHLLRRQLSVNQGEGPQQTRIRLHLDLGTSGSKNVRNKHLLSQPPSLWCLS